MADGLRVLVVDDEPLARERLRRLLDRETGVDSVVLAADGEAAVAMVTRLQPDVTLMDIRMPVLDGIAATRRILADGLATKVLVLTTFDLDEYVFEALQAGASGFLLKDAPAEELASAIRRRAPAAIRGPNAEARAGETERALELLHAFIGVAEELSLASFRRAKGAAGLPERAPEDA